MFAYLLYCWPKVLIESLTSLTNTALSCCAFNIPHALTQLSCFHNLSSPLSIITRVNPEEITNTLALNLIDWFKFWIRIVFHSMHFSFISCGEGGGGRWVTCALPFNWLDRKLCWKGFLSSGGRLKNNVFSILRCFDTVFQRPYRYFSITLKVLFFLVRSL